MPLNHQRISIVYAVITLSVFANLKDKNDITYTLEKTLMLRKIEGRRGKEMAEDEMVG